MEYKKKLIEVALPLEAINEASTREKSIRHGHPSTLHLWWARRPLTTARAVIFSSLVDDPSSHPELFPTEIEQSKERERLFALIEEFVKWENSNSENVMGQVRAEINKYNEGNLPPFLDPFAGGGSIPLEAQRLGLKANACDLNPVAVTINKSMIEIPPLFADIQPVNPEVQLQIGSESNWTGPCGLAEDVRYYGEWMKAEAFKRIGHLYPKVKVPEKQGGGEATVIAWIWARTVKCPNPACGCELPLVRSFSISKKKGKEAYIQPIIRENYIDFQIEEGKKEPAGTVNRQGARCIFCGQPVNFPYIRDEGKAHRMKSKLIALVAEGNNKRLFLPPDEEHRQALNIDRPNEYPSAPIPENALGFRVQLYGMNYFEDLYTARQLVALTTFSDLLKEVREKVLSDARKKGMMDDGTNLNSGGKGTIAYSEAIVVYLSMLIDQVSNQSSTLCSWHVNNTQMKSTFSRQSLPMVWDYAESNVFCSSTGSYHNLLERMVKAIRSLSGDIVGSVHQHNAMAPYKVQEALISTDPPYYDNIGYADLSDYFYLWLRNNLNGIYPSVFSTMMVPKSDELIATPFRFNGDKDKARYFFENGMEIAFRQMFVSASSEYPVTIYYAFKQTENDDEDEDSESKQTSIGWETMLQALMNAGFMITGTWPMRTEMTTGVKMNINVLASSIVLVCRKRESNAPVCTRREFVNVLKRELKASLNELQRSNIAPVDLAQSAIGPGMSVFSRFSKVLEADGTPMSVRSALQIINQELDAYYASLEGEMDADTRFCVAWYEQFGINEAGFGDADVLARAKNTSVERLVDDDVLFAARGKVRILKRVELDDNWNPVIYKKDMIWMYTQQLVKRFELEGEEKTASLVMDMKNDLSERAKELAYRLFIIAERKGWAEEAFAYNSLVVAWADILKKVTEMTTRPYEQQRLL